MFESFRKAIYKAINPFEGTMEPLWNVWKVNVGMAVLFARQSWQDIPDSIVQQGLGLEAQSRMNAEMNRGVGIGLGRLGIPAGPGIGIGMNPDQAFFVMTMARIKLSQGDPPQTPGMEQFAEGVLKGQIDPVQALIACAPEVARPQMVMALQAAQMSGMPQMVQLTRITAAIQAAASVPRARIPSFLSEVAAPRPQPNKAAA